MLVKLTDEDTQGWCYYLKNEDTDRWALFSEDFLIKLMQHPKFQKLKQQNLKENKNAVD